MPNAIRIHEYGGPEVMRWESVDVGDPARDQVRIRHRAIGLNFIDVYERTGLYAVQLPAVLGKEASGVVEAVGSSVKHLAVGDRVAYAGQGSGAYSEVRVMSAERVLKLPDEIDDRQAAAMMLKGLTAQMLLRQTWRVKRKDTLLVHSAAGGVGSMLVQWARHLGATVIGMVGSEEKAKKATELGANHVLITTGDWVADVRALTRGRGVDVVYDGVGRETFMQSLDCLRPRGLMVSYGNASGPVPAIAPLELSKRGSLYLTRPTLFHYIATRAALTRAAQELFGVVSRSIVNVQIGQTYPLQEAARAHADLEARRTTGSTVLIPGG
jgi:NADPH2:quinone reductase